MKRLLPSLLIGAVALLGAATTQAQTYQQVWSDEFTNGISSNWAFETGNNNGWGNNEQEYYQKANATVVNGVLQITAKKESVGGFKYTSARMKTQGLKDFKFGRMEARMKLPLGAGLWPGFWMMGSNISSVGWPKCGEIDIMEHVNADNTIYGTAHWDSNGHAQYGKTTTISNPADWHVYSVEWTSTAIKWFVDGTQYCVIDITNGTGNTGAFQNPFFFLLNLAVGGNLSGQSIDESKLPATLQVDYVRVYQLTNSAPAAKQLEAESANTNSGMQVETCSDTGGGQDMGYIDQGDYLVFNNVNFPTTGTYTIEYRVASGANGGTISSDLNAGNTQLGNTSIPGTGGWQNWTTVSRQVNINAGTYNFGVYAQTGGYNLNWVRITPPGGSARTSSTLAANANAAPTSLTLYPNPRKAGEPLTLSLPAFDPAAPAQVRLLDGVGREVWRTTATAATVDIAPALRAGLYMVEVRDASGRSVQKVVVE